MTELFSNDASDVKYLLDSNIVDISRALFIEKTQTQREESARDVNNIWVPVVTSMQSLKDKTLLIYSTNLGTHFYRNDSLVDSKYPRT